MTDIIKSENNVPRMNRDMNDGTYAEVVSTAGNIIGKFREAFETFAPNTNGSPWTMVNTGFDVVGVEGNALGASYLSMSRDPFSNDTDNDTIVETVESFEMPLDISIGLHASQRTVGQDFYVEIVDDDVPLPEYTPIAIASISQTTTTLTVTTATNHGLSVGQRITVYGIPDSRLNYPSLVVSSITSSTVFVVTAGPMGNLPSVTAGPFTAGFVMPKSAMGRKKNGTSMCLENTTATNASFFIKSNSGDIFPSGTLNGNHSATIGTTASVQLVNTAATYVMTPTNEQRIALQADRVQWTDAAIDTITGGYTSRAMRVQVVPDPDKRYKLRFRFAANRALSKPVGGGILSATKAGSTTATIVTKQPHGLTINDFITIYGILDQTNFANQATAVQVASVIDSVTFTVVFGASATATSFGGTTAIVYGGNLPSALGYTAQSITNATMASGILTLTGSGNWAGLSIGDIVDVFGADISSGTQSSVNGTWRVRNAATNQLTLEWYLTVTPPVDFASTPCAGAVIKRTSMRISFVRIFDYERERVEIMPRANTDVMASVPVVVNNNNSLNTTISGTPAVTLSGVANSVAGVAAHDAAVSGNPNRIAGRAVTANYTAVATGDTADVITTAVGVQVSKPYAIPEAGFNASLALTTTTAVAIAAAAGAGIKRHLTALQAINTGAAVTELIILDGATERWRFTLPVNDPVLIQFPTEITATANTALNANLSVAGTVRANFQGYTAP
jgi:hypothetical protein